MLQTPLAEVTTYQQMALVASAFAFSWSKWNLASGQDQVVFKVAILDLVQNNVIYD